MNKILDNVNSYQVFLIDIGVSEVCVILKKIMEFFGYLELEKISGVLDNRLVYYVYYNFFDKKGLHIKDITIEKWGNKSCLLIKDESIAGSIVITEDTIFNNSKIQLQQFDPVELVKKVEKQIEDAKEFMELYRIYTKDNHYMNRDTMIDFIKKYPFVPIAHLFFDDEDFIYSNGKVVLDQNDKVYEDSLQYPESDIMEVLIKLPHNGLRKRTEGNWKDGWYIRVTKNGQDYLYLNYLNKKEENKNEMFTSYRCRW